MSTKTTPTAPEVVKLTEKLRKLKAQHEFAVQNLNDQIATLKSDLENERTASRVLTRGHRTHLKEVRDEEGRKCRSLVEQIRAQLNLKFKEEIEKEKKRLTEKYQTKKKPSTASRISKIFKVGDTTASKSKTSHVKELVRRLNGLQTGPSESAAGSKPNKCVTKAPSDSSNQQVPIKGLTLGTMAEVHTSPSKHEVAGIDSDSITEDPIVPQIIVPKPECDLENLPDGSVTETEDGILEESNSVINSWTKGVGLETLYTLLSSAHLELQRAHLILQSNLRKEQRMRKHLEEKVRYLNSLMSQKSKQQLLINPINTSLSAQLDQCKEREGKLLEQLQELNDQNELLEFRVLELEQCSGLPSEHTLVKRTISRTPDTDISDSGVISLSPSEDIYCSDSDLHDVTSKLEPTTSGMGGDVKERLSLLCQSLDNVSERIIVQQAINLLRHYESRISSMETTVSNMCQEVAMCRSMVSSLEGSPSNSGSPPGAESCRKSATRMIATVLPFSGHPSCPRSPDDVRPFSSLPNPIRDEEAELEEELEEELMTIESPFRKLFRDTESMQESGIYFEDEDLRFQCQGTQTDSANQSRLSEELRKLAQIREKLEREQEREKCFKPIKQDKSKILCSRQELEYYKEEMERLERRLALYESCGEEQTSRLQAMLERDEVLKKQLHRLEEDNLKLRRQNQFLDMEKCEFEELENDTRLQCQRLEVKLNSINEKKLELQSQLSHNVRLISSLQATIEQNDKFKTETLAQLDEALARIQSLETTISCYEASLNKCEQKNFELEEKEIELKDRLHLLEQVLPVLIGYHVYRVVERCRAYWISMRMRSPSSNYVITSCDTSPNNKKARAFLPLCYSKHDSIDKAYEIALLDKKHVSLSTASHTNTCSLKNHVETQTILQDMQSHNSESKDVKSETNIERLSHDSSQNVQIICENCKNNNNNSMLNMNKENIQELDRVNIEKIEELNRMIKDLKIKEKLYEQTMSEADEMFSNMTLEYRVQIENLENQINASAVEMKAIKRELDKEREDNDRVSNVQLELMEEMKMKEGEKKQLNNMLECLRMQLEEEREESLKFKQEMANFKKLFETEKSKCKELAVDLKEANIEIKDLEMRVESKMKSYEKEIDKLCKKLEDLAVTNGELKEEVDTLENVVKELKLALTHERYKRDSLQTEMGAELQARAREVSELRRQVQGAGLKSTAQEIEEALASMECLSEDDGCHLSITEIPDQLEKLTEKLAESQDHTKTCEACKSNLSFTVQELMDQICTMKTSPLCQGPHNEEYKSANTLPRTKTSSVESTKPSTPSISHPMTDVKCKEKDMLIFNLAFELKQLADRNLWVRYPALVDNLRKHISECPDFNRAVLVQYLNGKLVMTPKFSDKSLLDLRIIKAVGSNSLLISWKPPPSHCAVLEFLVYINGEYLRRIYAEQGRALLHPVDIQRLSKPIQVTLMSADSKYPSASAYYC